MSIIRENQIRQILDDENILKRQIISRQLRGIRNYEENIKPPQVMDLKIVDENKSKINTFVQLVNELYLRLKVITYEHTQFIETFTNKRGGEYRKYIELLNIKKPFDLWEEIMTTYINPKINQITREQIINNLQKISSYVEKIINYLEQITYSLCAMYLNENNLISDEELYFEVYKKRVTDVEKISGEIKELEQIDTELLLKEHIETLAFYKCISRSINTNKIEPLNKQEIAFEIAQIINEIYVKYPYEELNKYLIGLFRGTELPELAPYFRRGFDDFRDRFDELEAMEGTAEELPAVAPALPAFAPPPPPPFIGEDEDEIVIPEDLVAVAPPPPVVAPPLPLGGVGEAKEGEAKEDLFFEFVVEGIENYLQENVPIRKREKERKKILRNLEKKGTLPAEVYEMYGDREDEVKYELKRMFENKKGKGKPKKSKKNNKHPTIRGKNQIHDFNDYANDPYYITY